MAAKLFNRVIPLLLITLCFCISVAHADMVTSIDYIVDSYKNQASGWQSSLLGHATSLFWLLAFIEFGWAMIQLAFRGADFGDFMSTVVNQILFIGFFFWLLTNSVSFSQMIVNSFKQAGAEAGGVSGIAPSDVFQIGLKIILKILDSISALSPIDSLGLLISAIVIMACFALITAFSVLALIESFVVIYAGVLLMGFGGSRWTKDYAIRTFQYAVSVGAKLFILTLLLAIGKNLMEDWLNKFNANENFDVVVVIGASIVMLALVKTVPDMVQGLINGASVGTGGALTAAAATVGGAVGAVAGAAVGASMATGSAAKLASEQLLDAKTAGNAPTSKMGTAGFMMGSMAKNLGSSLKQDIGSRFSGQNHGHGNMGGRMSGDMSRQAQELKANRQAPQNTPANGNPGTGQNNNPTTSLDKPDNTIS